jgi:hypothetical protein
MVQTMLTMLTQNSRPPRGERAFRFPAGSDCGGSEALKISEMSGWRKNGFVPQTRVTGHRTSRQLIVAADGYPKLLCKTERIDTRLLPPTHFVTGPMHFAVASPA